MTNNTKNKQTQKIAHVIAQAGICSRRNAEKMIENKRVRLNHKIIESPAIRITKNDHISIDGKPIPKPENIRLWKYHKKKGSIVTHKDTHERTTIFQKLPPNLPYLISVGRLDINSEGLILLTNNGYVARKLELPKTAWIRRYKVRAYGYITNEILDTLKNGTTIDGIKYAPVKAEIQKNKNQKKPKNQWIIFALKEGKNREIRKICNHLNLKINKLIRLSYGPFHLGNLKPEEIKEIPKKIIDEHLGTEFQNKIKAVS